MVFFHHQYWYSLNWLLYTLGSYIPFSETFIISVFSFKINGALIVKLVRISTILYMSSSPALDSRLQSSRRQSQSNFYQPSIFFDILIVVFRYIFETGCILIKYLSLTEIKLENGKPVHFTLEIPYPHSALPKLPVLLPWYVPCFEH